MIKGYRTGLLTLLVSLFIFSSCKKGNNSLGLELPDEVVQGVKAPDTLTVLTTTVPADTFNTSLQPAYPVGYMADGTFGTTEASTIMNVLLPNASYSFGTNAVLDSAILVLRYTGTTYGDTTAVYPFQVRQLNNAFIDESNYASNRTWAAGTDIVGSRSTKLYPNTPGTVLEPVAGAADTMRKITPQLRIPLNKEFISQQILALSSTYLSNSALFGRVFKGLQISVDKSAVTGKGGMAMFRFDSNYSSVDLYYKRQNATTTSATDTVRASFPIRTTNTSASSTTQATKEISNAATIIHNYAGTPVAAAIGKTGTTASYAQGLGGVKTRIKLPYLANLKAAIGKNVVINRAELVVETTADSYFTAPQALNLYKTDITGTPVLLDDLATLGDPSLFRLYGGTYDAANSRYVFNVTNYVQNLMDGRIKDYGTYLTPGLTNGYAIGSNALTAARAVLGSGTAGSAKKIKLNVYYTVTK